MLSITLGASDRRNPDVDDGSGMDLSGGSFGITWVGNLEISDPGEGDTLGNS